MFNKPITQLITHRFSCRTFIEIPIENETRQHLSEFISTLSAGPFNTTPRYKLVAIDEKNSTELRGLGTFGFVKGATGFIAGVIDTNSVSMEDFGYLSETIILYATNLGLGTCWLGATFNKKNFSEKMILNNQEIVPAVIAVGYAKDKRRTVDSLIRWGAGANKRKPWEHLFFDSNLNNPITHAIADEFVQPLDMVRLAPSASNKQPWRIVKEKDEHVFHFFLQRTKEYDQNQKILKKTDLQRIDMGIAMCHFELTSLELGLKGKWLSNDPEIKNIPSNTEYIASWIYKQGISK